MSKLEQRFHQLRKSVLALSGANKEVLALVPSERNRFESLGWAILSTSGVASVSMWFALASAVGINGFLAVPVAVGWGLVIMGIDRWLITSMPIDGGRKFAMAAPRLALALLLGTLISTPLVLRIFQSEINAQIAKMQQQNYSTFLQQERASTVAEQVDTYSSELKYLDNVIATHGAATSNTASDPELVTYNTQLTNLNSELTHWTNLKNDYYKEYICQLYGGPACPKKGFGPAAKDSQANYNAASQEVSTLKGQINQVQTKIQQRDAQLSSNSAADQQARYQQALAQQPSVKNEYDAALQRQSELQANFFASNQASHGILIRLEALSQLSSGNFTVTAARFLLFLVFLFIECLPVTVKLLQRPGLYEEALTHARNAERRDAAKFYRFRLRHTGQSGTAALPPMLRMEPEYRIDAIWNPTRPLPGAVVSEDDRTEVVDEPKQAWEHGGSVEDGRADSDPPEQRWYGANRWRNYWEARQAEDDERPAEPTRRDMYLVADPSPDSSDMPTRPDYGRVAAAPRPDGWPEHRRVADESYGDSVYPREAQPDEGRRTSVYGSEERTKPDDDSGSRPESDREQATRVDAWHDDRVDETPGGQARAVPAADGTPLSWDEDE